MTSTILYPTEEQLQNLNHHLFQTANQYGSEAKCLDRFHTYNVASCSFYCQLNSQGF